MSELEPYNRRRFLTNLTMAAGAVGLGMSHINSESLEIDNRNMQIIDSELASLNHANGWSNTRKFNTSDLKNKVVVINFCTYTCINWLRQLPYIRGWSGKYKAQGLKVVGVHTPEFSFEHDITNVTREVKALNCGYPIAIDNNRIFWEAFNNNYWPAIYVLDGKGKIRHQQFGEGRYEECEHVIQRLLEETGTVGFINSSGITEGEGIEAPADWTNLLSPENYLGQIRTNNFLSRSNSKLHKRKSFVIPTQLTLNEWGLSGKWSIGDENIVLREAGGRIAYQFHARDLHLVMGPTVNSGPIRFKISIDGESPETSHGQDADEHGNGILLHQRLYQLVRQQDRITSRRFEIEFLDPGLEAFAFTFG